MLEVHIPRNNPTTMTPLLIGSLFPPQPMTNLRLNATLMPTTRYVCYRHRLKLFHEGQAAIALHVSRLCRPTGTGVRVQNAADFGRHDCGTLRVGGWPSRSQDQDTGTDLCRLRRHVKRKALRHIGVQRLQRVLQAERPPQTHLQVSAPDCGYDNNIIILFLKYYGKVRSNNNCTNWRRYNNILWFECISCCNVFEGVVLFTFKQIVNLSYWINRKCITHNLLNVYL